MQTSWKLQACGLAATAWVALGGCGVKIHPYPDAGLVETDPVVPPGPVGQPGVGPTPALMPGGGGGSGGGASGAGGSGGNVGGNTGGGAGMTPPAAGGGTGSAGPSDAQAATPAPPVVGPGVTIGGRFIPKEKVIVFLHVGHSDMAGRASGPPEMRPYMFDTHPQLWVYQKGGAFRPAREPTCGDEQSVNRSGPGMALLRNGLLQAPDAQLISIGHGHSGSTLGFCPNFRKGRPLYATFMEAALELKGKVTFAGLFTMFGITEYHTGTQGLATTGDCILGLINDVRADLGLPELPLLVGDWNQNGTGIYAPTGEYGSVVKPQLMALPGRDRFTGLISTVGLAMEDDRHLNMAGQKAWAERAFVILTERGLLPWATRPRP